METVKIAEHASANAKTMAAYGRNINVRLGNATMLNEIEFNEVVGKIRVAWAHRDFAGALAEIEAVNGNVTPEMTSHCLLLSGNIKEDQGLSVDARQDWLAAIPHSRGGSFGRHCLEYQIGRSYENAGQRADAQAFYRSAIQTCAYGDEFAGNQSLSAYLTLNDGQILSEDQDDVAAAIVKSWRVLELSGEPDLNDFSGAVIKLVEGLSEKVRKIKEG